MSQRRGSITHPTLWPCSGCGKADARKSKSGGVQCDICDGWWHLSCATISLSSAAAVRSWVCPPCRRRRDSKPSKSPNLSKTGPTAKATTPSSVMQQSAPPATTSQVVADGLRQIRKSVSSTAVSPKNAHAPSRIPTCRDSGNKVKRHKKNESNGRNPSDSLKWGRCKGMYHPLAITLA